MSRAAHVRRGICARDTLAEEHVRTGAMRRHAYRPRCICCSPPVRRAAPGRPAARAAEKAPPAARAGGAFSCYSRMHMTPPLPSLTMRVMALRSLTRVSSFIPPTLPARPS